jgi:uncharacterized protein (DUF2252 family)
MTTERRTQAERMAQGRAARKQVPRSSHASLEDAPGRDPVGLLEAQARTRIASLVPIRYGRMLVSPLAFMRGAAVVMARDLAATPRSGLDVQLCGDAHLENFGGFASPERELVFDLNDFDETLPGPFEWDVKRLAASFEVAGRERGFAKAERRRAVLQVVGAYRTSLRRFAAMDELDVWYSKLDEGAVLASLSKDDPGLAERAERLSAKARAKDRMRALAKLTHTVDGEPRFDSEPPLLVPIAELARDEGLGDDPWLRVGRLFSGYRNSLQGDRQTLLARFRPVDLARKVVGIGSVGTGCYIVLLVGRDGQDPLFLQIKEAQASVLEPHAGPSPFATNGRRVVEGQRLLQAASDIFLGWTHTEGGGGGVADDFYLRQLWDWKSAVDVETISPRGLLAYAGACGWTLARAHARSGDRIAIAAYLGKSDRFDRALADFAAAYADLTERDHRALREAVDASRVTAVEGE